MSKQSKIQNTKSTIEMSGYRLKDSDINIIADTINAGGVVILPTDTVYGLFCLASNKKAVSKIYGMKGRVFNKPLQIFFESVSKIFKFADVLPKQKIAIKRRLPGSYTLILQLKKGLKLSFLKDTVGARHIKYAFINKIIKKTGPLAATSANISGQKDAKKYGQINKMLIKKADMSVKCDLLPCGKPSKVLLLTEAGVKVIRR